MSSESVIRAAHSMAVAGNQFNNAVVVPVLKKIAGSEEWEKAAEQSHPIPLALFYHLLTIVELLESCVVLSEAGRTNAVGILSRSILESARWAQWIMHPQVDGEKRLRRARSCLVFRREVRRWVHDESKTLSGDADSLDPKTNTKIRKEVERSVGEKFKEDAYGIAKFPSMLKSVGREEDYALYRLTSYISHGLVVMEQGDASDILCGAAFECYKIALVLWESLNIPFQVFAKHFRNSGESVMKERVLVARRHGIDPFSGLPPDIAKGLQKMLGE